MPLKSKPKIALIGNPNSGKSSLFNHLTGLNQKVGNFPGVTVDKKTGTCKLNDFIQAQIIDLPGTYSIYPRTLDERIVFDVLSNPEGELFPDIIVVVVDASNLKRNLLLFTQIKDLGIPVVMALNMNDVAKKAGIHIDLESLKKDLGVQIVKINARKGEGLEQLKYVLSNPILKECNALYDVSPLAPELIAAIKEKYNLCNVYRAYQLAQQYSHNTNLSDEDKGFIVNLKEKHDFNTTDLQAKETIGRYEFISKVIKKGVHYTPSKEIKDKEGFSLQIDRWITHKVWGYLIFFGILFLIFQALFSWAEKPMDWIDMAFSSTSSWLDAKLPDGPLADLLTEGIIPGLAGIFLFIPQIALLFAFISVLEESGYMSRVVFLMDKIMRKFGLNGKSVVPLISGVACAIPAIMATRSIDNWKDRLITIFVTPFMSCSARLPIYIIIISLVVPDREVLGILNLQGLALMGMYLLGFVAALFTALLMKIFLSYKEKSFFIMELPAYKWPRWKNVGLTIYEKVMTFSLEAGKVIMAISIVLWVLASYGPGGAVEEVENTLLGSAEYGAFEMLSEEELENKKSADKLEASYAGIFGKTIEPVIQPLGFDWKIGIALITSFAAREVFVGTMATIYSIGSSGEDEQTIKSRMKSELNPLTGQPFYTPALAFSLLIFYAFAMQCMSTLAVVYRETKSWKWPMAQLVYMTGLAYLCSFIVYTILS
jgi:ferrous iron transport protein B